MDRPLSPALTQGTKLVSYSPFRISFAGGGTDINPFCDAYGGSVINTTIDRGVTVIYTPDEYELEISSRDFLKSVMIVGENDNGDVLHKMAGLFRNYGIDRGRISINSGVPPGSGLGSSSALTTAVLSLIHMHRNESRDPWEIAREAFSIEKNYFGITLGKQDPFAIAVGGFKFMEFTGGTEINHPLNQNQAFWRELEGRTLLIYTGKTRESSAYLRDQVDQSAAGNSQVVSNLREMKDLTHEMYSCALSGDMGGFLRGINRGWELKRNLGRNVSNSKIDRIINEALSNGAEAAKLMGGGGEGFVLAVCRPGSIEQVQSSMMKYSDFVIRVSFEESGTRSQRFSQIFLD
jgi:D-glycero-alpha-D-manno-heptose-7-phosphate kinase